MILLVRMDSSSEVEGIPVTRHMIDPSCNCGMNSLPRNGKMARPATSAVTAVTTTTFFLAKAFCSNGW